MDVKARAKPPTPDPPPLPGTRPPRRITCKYLLPLLPSVTDKIEVCQKAFCSAFVISTKRVRLQREKLIHSLGLNSYHHQKSVKKKRKPEDESSAVGLLLPTALQQVALQQAMTSAATILDVVIENCDQLVSLEMDVRSEEVNLGSVEAPPKKTATANRLVDDPLIPMGISVPDGVTIVPVTATPDHDRDIAIVNNFFSNQLWKPEYIGAHS